MNRLPFFNRESELKRLQKTLSTEPSGLAVLYGRRRCGKSRLLQELSLENSAYYLSDKQEPSLQIQSIAQEIGRGIPEFGNVIYPSWSQLFSSLNERTQKPFILILDEFPYLVAGSPELPSILQKQIDLPNNRIFFLICGSSQRMMQGLVLDATEPLYGRASQVIKLQPLAISWIQKAFDTSAQDAIVAYALWGGIPRYWEFASPYPDAKQAVRELVFDRNGPLHEEPLRLLSEDTKGDTQAHSILSVVGQGTHRLSKIASRLQKPASSLTRPLVNLLELGYLRKEIPFGASPEKTKHTLYRLNDPFLEFWYRFVYPHQSLLQQDHIDYALEYYEAHLSQHVGLIWEDLARAHAGFHTIAGKRWKPAQRWWGKGLDGQEMEMDLVAESYDGQCLLIGEAKWEENTKWNAVISKLEYQLQNLPFSKNYPETQLVYYSKTPAEPNIKQLILTPEDVISHPTSLT